VEANAYLSIQDESATTIALLMDKFALRRRLQTLGLSTVNTELLSPAGLKVLQASGASKFISKSVEILMEGESLLALKQIFLQKGAMISDTDKKEVFAGQMLWKLARERFKEECQILLAESHAIMRIEYV
jgi:hypothetical protein